MDHLMISETHLEVRESEDRRDPPKHHLTIPVWSQEELRQKLSMICQVHRESQLHIDQRTPCLPSRRMTTSAPIALRTSTPRARCTDIFGRLATK